MVQCFVRVRIRGGGRPVLNRDRQRGLRRVKMLQVGGPARYTARQRRGVPAHAASARRCSQIAQLVKADVGLEVAFAEAGGWDTHVNQGSAAGSARRRGSRTSVRAIAALARDLGDRMDDVVILTMSEFGRAVAENGNRGTDHGHGNAMFVIGGQTSAAARSTAGGRAWRASSATRARSRRDDRLPRRCSRKSSVRHLGVTDTRSIFPGYDGQPDWASSGTLRADAPGIGGPRPCCIYRHPHPAGPHRIVEARAQHRADAGTGRRRPRRAACARTPRPINRRSSRACSSQRARSGSAAPSSARRRCSPTPASPTSGCRIRCIPSNADRVCRPGQRVTLSFIVDNPTGARGRRTSRCSAGRTLDVLVKVDVGFHRCGIDPRRATPPAFLSGESPSLPGLRSPRPPEPRRPRLRRGFRGRAEAGIASRRSRAPAQCSGSAPRVRHRARGSASVARRRRALFRRRAAGLTELRPGNYVYFDRTQVGLGAARSTTAR